MDEQMARPMASNERLMIAAANVGRPSTIALLATLPTSTQHPFNQTKLLAAVDHLLQAYPLLRCGVVGGRTQYPSWQVQPALPSARIVRTEESSASDEELLTELVNSGDTVNGTLGPLWRVTLFAGSETRVGLSISHALADGIGARNLFCDLLRLLRQADIPGEAALPAGPLAPTWDSTEDLALRFPVILVVIWEMLCAQVWSFLHPLTRVVPAQAPFDRSPNECALIRLSETQVLGLKALAKQHDINTLQPLLHGAVITSAFLSHSGKTLEKGLIAQMCPISARDESLGHTRSTGNFTGATFGDLVLNKNDSFVKLCADYSRLLKDPATHVKYKKRANLSEMLPHPKDSARHELDGKLYPVQQKDQLLLDMAQGKGSYKMDVGTSNLMRMDGTGWEGDEGFRLSAAVNAGVSYGPLCVTVLSAADGEMSINVAWQTSTLEEGAYAKRFVGQLKSLLERLARGEVEEGATIESLRVLRAIG